MVRACTLLLFILCLGLPLSGVAQDAVVEQSNPNSLKNALVHAFHQNPTLKAAREQLKATHERLPQAAAGWRPTAAADFNLTSTDIDGSNFGGSAGATSKDLNVSFNQPLYRGGRTFSAIKAAKSAIQAQRELLRVQEQDILLDVVTAYMDVLRDQALLELSENNKDLIAKQLEATNERFEVGELTRTDVSQARARLARSESDVIRAKGNVNTSIAVFEQIVGYRPGELEKPNVSLPLPETLDEATILAESNNPLILSSVYAHKSSEEDVDGIYGELLPEIGLLGSWNKALDPQPGITEESTTKTIGLTASIPLYQGGAVQSRVRQAKHTANQRYLEILETKRQIRQETIRNWEILQATSAEIRSRRSQVQASTIAREGVNEETMLGERTILDALDADQELLDAKVSLVTTERDQIVAQFALLETIGQLSPDKLEFKGVEKELDGHLREMKWKFFGLSVDSVGDGL